MPSLSLNAPPAPQASGEGPAQNVWRARAANWWRSLWPGRNAKIDDIRRLMLAQLDVVPDPELRLALAEQIARATCLQSLWRLRSEVMAALVEVHGELLARQRMTDISFMFAGLLERDHRAEDPAPQLQPEPGWPASTRTTRTAAHAQGLVDAGPQVRLDH